MKYKKIWMTALILALIIVLSGSVQAASYANEKCGGNATWQIDDTGTLVISGTGAVTSAPWYDYYRYDFDKVVISEGITTLSDQIFRNCSNLQQVTIPVSLTSVGEGCFTGCNSLETVIYNGTLARWQKISFLDTSSPLFLTKLTCTDSNYNLCGSNVFWILGTDGTLYITGSGAMSDFFASAPAPWHDYYGLIKSVTIGEGITTIGSYAFYNLDPYEPFAMTQITIPKSLLSVGTMAFSDCTLLTNVYYADTVDSWTRLTVAMSQELYEILLEAKESQERNARILGSDYKHYWYTREYDPKFAERTFESFNIKKGKGGFYTADTFGSGIINTYGIGYPLHFVNVREDGSLLRPDYATDMCAVIHGMTGGPVLYKDFNFHSLRNTFASRCRSENIPEYVIKHLKNT